MSNEPDVPRALLNEIITRAHDIGWGNGFGKGAQLTFDAIAMHKSRDAALVPHPEDDDLLALARTPEAP